MEKFERISVFVRADLHMRAFRIPIKMAGTAIDKLPVSVNIKGNVF